MAQVAEPDLTGSWNPESTRPRGVLGSALAPASHRIAGILVHFLWKMGREEEALEELKRYIDLRA